MNIDFKKILPHLMVILFFIAICAVYFSPVLQGKELKQHDIEQWEGMAKEIKDFREKFDDEPLWTRSMFGGMPAYQISVLYPANLMKHVDKALNLWLPTPISFIFLSLTGFYLLLLSLKIDFRLAVAGAIGYAFSSYNFIIIMAGHNSKMHAIALVPLVVAGVMMVFNKKYLLGGAITAVALSLEIYANHLQITYYLAIALVILGLIELYKTVRESAWSHFIRSSGVLLLAVVLAVLPNITSLWATYEYGKDTTRGPSELTEKKVSTGLDIDYAFAWSYGISETMTLLIPNFMGGPSVSDVGKNSATYKALVDNGAGSQANQFVKQAPLYWGEQSFTAGPVYMGAIVIFLFVLGIIMVRNEYKWWLVSVTVLFIMLSWGKHFLALNEWFFHFVPGYNKFRTVSMILALCTLTMVLLGMLGLQKFFDKSSDFAVRKKALKLAFYIVGGICLLFAVAPGLFFDFSSPADESMKQYDWLIEALRSDRANALRTDAFRSFAFIALAFGLLWYSVGEKIKFQYAALGLAALILVDMWPVNKRYLNDDNFTRADPNKQIFTPTQANLAIMQDTEPGYRVMNTSVSTFNDASTSYFHHSIGGYHGAKLKRYQELIENQISQNNMSVLNMLNTKYFIVRGQESGQPMVQQNPGALGAAWYVREFKVVDNADQEIAALTDFDPSQTAIVDKRYMDQIEGFKISFDSSATIRLTGYQPNHLTYETNASSDQLAVLSEIYYANGWNAYLDGNLVPHFRANYVLRAMKIPAGKHTVEFKFEPKVYYIGEKIAMAGSVLLILFAVGAGVRELRSPGSAKSN